MNNFECVCGYEYEEECSMEIKVIKGDEKPIKIEGNILEIRTPYWEDDKRVSLIACPKCHTVKIDL